MLILLLTFFSTELPLARQDQPAQVTEALPFQEQDLAFFLEFHKAGPFFQSVYILLKDTSQV